MQNDDPQHPLLSHGRSFLMWQTLLNAPTLEIEDKHLMYQGVGYRIIESALCEVAMWLSADNIPLVSIGGRVTAREFLLIHPHRGRLSELLSRFVTTQQHRPRHSPDIVEHQVHDLLHTIAQTVREVLNPDSRAVTIIIEEHKRHDTNCVNVSGRAVPCIDFEVFLSRAAACRHFAPLTCLYIASMIKEGFLPTGTVHLERYDTEHNAHAMAVYTCANTIWHIDPTMLQKTNPAHEVISIRRPNANEDDSPATVPLSPTSSLSASQGG